MAKKRRAPWKRKNPRKAKGKATAKQSAKRAGRPYPNLVDNMRVAAGGRGKKRAKKTRAAKPRKKR
jgi:hypothetical protein